MELCRSTDSHEYLLNFLSAPLCFLTVKSGNIAQILSFLQQKYYIAFYCTAAAASILLPYNREGGRKE